VGSWEPYSPEYGFARGPLDELTGVLVANN